jgi:hypothetical protein
MALITTKEKMKEFLAISTHTEISSVAPYIKRAEREFIIPQIGQTLYDDLNSFVESSGSSSGSGSSGDDILLTKVQESVINFAFYLYFPMLEVHVGENGVQRMESETRKSAYQYQGSNLRDSLLISGYETLGKTLDYLEENKDTYTSWSGDAKIYKRYKYFLLNTPELFQEYFDIKNSWATFFSLRPIIKRIEDLHLEAVLGAAFLIELKDEIESNNVTDDDLIEMIRKAVVSLTLSDAAHDKIIQIGKDGTFEARRAGLSIKKTEPADIEKISSFINKNLDIGDKYTKRLVEHLNNNASASKYKTYFDSDLYKDPSSEDYSKQTWDNSSDGKSVIV